MQAPLNKNFVLKIKRVSDIFLGALRCLLLMSRKMLNFTFDYNTLDIYILNELTHMAALRRIPRANHESRTHTLSLRIDICDSSRKRR